MVAGGPSLGGMGNPQGQPGGEKNIYGADGKAAWGGVGGGVQADCGGMVCGRSRVPPGVVGAGCYALWTQSLWGRSSGRGTGAGRTPGDGRIEAAGMERCGIENLAQGRPAESGFGTRIARPDNDAVGLDCRAPEHGQPGIFGMVVRFGQKTKREVGRATIFCKYDNIIN